MYRAGSVALIVLIATAVAAPATPAAGSGTAARGFAAILAGTPSLHLRYRYERADDDLVPGALGEASTLRAALGWRSGSWGGFSVFGEVEHVGELGLDRYRDGPAPLDPGSARFPVIADPPGTELNEAYLRYAGGYGSELRLGRQAITYREAPLHRHVGNVLWRQNWQTYDGVTLSAAPQAGLQLNYGYVTRVNRIFGAGAPDPFDAFECDCHLLNAHYEARPELRLEIYGYLLDIDNAPANALDTWGARASGSRALSARWTLLYAAELATQDAAAGNPHDVAAEYYLAALGVRVQLPFALLPALTLKLDYEVLEGDGTSAFQTPLATGHAFQGWADRFLVTPRDGIEDVHVTAAAAVLGGQLMAVWHRLAAQRLGYVYGEEIDVQYTRALGKRFTLGAKAAIYMADRNPRALARAGAGPNHDVTRFWVWAQFDY